MSFADGLNAANNRAQLYESKRQNDQALQKAGYNPVDMSVIPGSSADVEKQQNALLLMQMNALQGKIAARESDDAMTDFADTGDTKYLNNTMNNNPTIKKALGATGVQNFANIDFANDGALLAGAGMPESYYDTPEKQSVIKKNIYKTYDGEKWNIGLLNNAVKNTGYMTRVGANKGQKVLDNHEEFVKLISGPKVHPYTVDGNKYEAEIRAAAEETKLPPNLIASMIHKESKGKPGAVSTVDGKSYRGLMQIGDAAAAEVGIPDPKTPAENVLAGARYLAKQLKTYGGNTRLALAAYNAGPGKVQDYKGIPPYAETQDYVKTIMSNYASAESMYNSDDPGSIDAGKYLNDRVNQIPEFTPAPLAADGSVKVGVHGQPQDLGQPVKGPPISEYFNADNTDKVTGGIPTPAEIQVIKDRNERVRRRAQGRIDDVNNFFLDQSLATGKTKTSNSDSLTADMKNLAAGETKQKELFNAFGGEDAFYATDFSKPENRRRADSFVAAITKLQGRKFDATDKKNIAEVRGLIALGGTASTLTDSQTGFFDSTFADVKKSFSDDIGGVEGRSAYEAFRNITRSALVGASQSPQEIANFDKMLGSLGQKRGPILTQLKIALGQVQAKLNTVGDLGNTAVSHVLIGADQSKLDTTIQNLQKSIDQLSGKPADGQAQQKLDERTSKQIADEIFGAN